MEEFDRIEIDNRFALRGALFPPVELRLIQFDQAHEPLVECFETLNTDIAVVPQLLEGGDKYLPRVVDDEALNFSESFKPLYDPPVFIQPGGGEGLSIALKPERSTY